MTIGLTDGVNNFSIWNTDSEGSYLQGYRGLYGQSVGATSSLAGVQNKANKGVGITTDPAKSGLITKFSGLTLGTVTSKKLGSFYIRY